jgi:nucleoside-diphosphate-sugar epimerase
MNVPKIEGKTIDITDGDNSITWGKYLNDLAKIAKQAPIKKNVSKKTALIIGNLMLFVNKVFRTEPWVTPVAVSILTNNKKVSIDKAEKLLGYKPIISYNKGIENIKKWLHKYYNI